MPPDVDDEVWLADALCRLTDQPDAALRDEIAERTDWLAIRGARRFASRGEPFDDLLQVARIGLLHAIDRFDPTMNVPFGAYATPTIMGELRRHFRDHTWSVHVPRRAKDLRHAVIDATDRLAKELGRSPKVAEIAEAIGIEEDTVLETMEASRAYRSYDLADHAEHASVETNGDFDLVMDRDVVVGLLDRLAPRERMIMYLRFYEELSQAQIAERIGTSQVHVGRLITASLVALRSHADPEQAAS